MGAQRFKIVGVNPNESTGGGGCLCSETRNPDCEGPFAVFEVPEMDSNVSPFPVLCLGCAKAVVNIAETGETLAGGEPAIEAEAVEEESLEDDVPRV